MVLKDFLLVRNELEFWMVLKHHFLCQKHTQIEEEKKTNSFGSMQTSLINWSTLFYISITKLALIVYVNCCQMFSSRFGFHSSKSIDSVLLSFSASYGFVDLKAREASERNVELTFSEKHYLE